MYKHNAQCPKTENYAVLCVLYSCHICALCLEVTGCRIDGTRQARHLSACSQWVAYHSLSMLLQFCDRAALFVEQWQWYLVCRNSCSAATNVLLGRPL